MSSQLYLFAPENDMALAFGGRYYTPTPAAVAIARDLSLLPLWYAQSDGAVVLAQQSVDVEMQKILDMLSITARAVTKPPLDVVQCMPWGWSDYMVYRFKRAGVDSSILPDEDAIKTIRELSGRAISRSILQALSQEGVGYELPPIPEVLRSEAEVQQYVMSQPVSMLKSPWSSSGRGVWCVRGEYDAMTARAASGIIRKQGYIMGECRQEKLMDFAMEFYSDGNSVQFAGYSLFDTDARGAYQGNILDTDEAIEKTLSQYVDRQLLHRTCKTLQTVLSRLIAPYYTGYMGVDMILYRAADGRVLIHPCIELNLRMSMGMVARIIADRYVAYGSKGVYRVDYFPHTAALQEMHLRLQQQEPLCIDSGRVLRGYVPLTAIEPDTHYIAYILVQER